jgi:hypothetical protein
MNRNAAQEFLCALRCFSSQQAKNRACWEQLRANLHPTTRNACRGPRACGARKGRFAGALRPDFAALDSLALISGKAALSRAQILVSWAWDMNRTLYRFPRFPQKDRKRGKDRAPSAQRGSVAGRTSREVMRNPSQFSEVRWHTLMFRSSNFTAETAPINQ